MGEWVDYCRLVVGVWSLNEIDGLGGPIAFDSIDGRTTNTDYAPTHAGQKINYPTHTPGLSGPATRPTLHTWQ